MEEGICHLACILTWFADQSLEDNMDGYGCTYSRAWDLDRIANLDTPLHSTLTRTHGALTVFAKQLAVFVNAPAFSNLARLYVNVRRLQHIQLERFIP